MMKRHLLEAATLIVAAVLCATIANALASRERKMALVGTYPNALKVPQEAPTNPVDPIAAPPAATTSAAPTTTLPAPTTSTVTPTTITTPITTTHPASAATPEPTQPAPAPPPATSHQPPANSSIFKPHPDKPWIEIGYADVAALVRSGALTLDARRTANYEQGHIAGARPFSVWESDVEEKVRALWNERNSPAEQTKPIVVYCTGGDCEDSHNLAQKLFDAEFTNVYVYRDGFPDWQKHGGAIHTGGQP
jgi:rhodanese-related sulfurtransferase